MKQFFAAALVTLSLVMSGAQAQTAAQADPAAVAAGKELMEAMKFRDMMKISFAQIEQSMPQMMLQGATGAINANAKLNAAQKKKAIAQATKNIPEAVKAFSGTMNDPRLLDELSDEMTPLYVKYFNADELRAMTAFYRSPVGAKMLQTMPQLLGESMQITQRAMLPRMTAMIEKLTQARK